MACKTLKCVGKSMKCMLAVNNTRIQTGAFLLAVLIISYIGVPGPVGYFIAGLLS